eukprot:COSAG02_NODE_95_length_37416_cov_60.512742_15_plen_50_part_00
MFESPPKAVWGVNARRPRGRRMDAVGEDGWTAMPVSFFGPNDFGLEKRN